MSQLDNIQASGLSAEQIKAVYFVGAGGIGMSALERYFLACGLSVAGYDRTACP